MAARVLCATAAVPTALAFTAAPALAQDRSEATRIAELEARVEALEAANRRLMAVIEARTGEPERAAAPRFVAPGAPEPLPPEGVAAAAPPPAGPAAVVTETAEAGEMDAGGSVNFVGTNAPLAFAMLDHAENVNTRPLIQLQAQARGELEDRVTLSGSITALIDWQASNRDSKFGYLMRHPTASNQIGNHVSEAVLHSVQLGVTARLMPGVTGYAELLYDPEQSFGSGTITALARNQVQLRRGWVLFGDLDRAPLYALVGKMDTPFGLNDTVSPFTNSTNWHSFAGLAYGATVGYYGSRLHLRAMAIQGGAQFRSANVPVHESAVPSQINNYAFDARYTIPLGGPADGLMLGASYEHGSPYCQEYPVTHFSGCRTANPAWDAYAKLTYGPVTMIGEYAETVDPWAGSHVPDPSNPLSVYPAVRTRAFTVGARYGFREELGLPAGDRLLVSAEFSKFIAGAEGSPWERQSQAVAGLSWFLTPSVNLFGEYIRVNGYVPLNFLSGGNLPGGASWSEREGTTDVLLTGVQAAF